MASIIDIQIGKIANSQNTIILTRWKSSFNGHNMRRANLHHYIYAYFLVVLLVSLKPSFIV